MTFVLSLSLSPHFLFTLVGEGWYNKGNLSALPFLERSLR